VRTSVSAGRPDVVDATLSTAAAMVMVKNWYVEDLRGRSHRRER
jgi:hypothetical protein